MRNLLLRFESLTQALVDASSAIYMDKAGFLDPLRRAIVLHAPPAVLAEIGPNAAGIRPIPSPGGHETGDEALLACARGLGLPVISEDRKILQALKREKIPFYNALMMLHFLLFKGRIPAEEHARCLETLKKIAWYDKKVWAIGEEVFSLIKELC